MFNGKAEQDKFVLKNKKKSFLEIGSNHQFTLIIHIF